MGPIDTPPVPPINAFAAITVIAPITIKEIAPLSHLGIVMDDIAIPNAKINKNIPNIQIEAFGIKYANQFVRSGLLIAVRANPNEKAMLILLPIISFSFLLNTFVISNNRKIKENIRRNGKINEKNPYCSKYDIKLSLIVISLILFT